MENFFSHQLRKYNYGRIPLNSPFMKPNLGRALLSVVSQRKAVPEIPEQQRAGFSTQDASRAL